MLVSATDVSLYRNLYEEKCTDWQAQRYPQIVGHRIYLQLAQPLVEGTRYDIRYDGGSTTLNFHASETACESFRVNQVGYNPLGARRDAFWAPWCGDLGPLSAKPEEVWLCERESGRRRQQPSQVSAPRGSRVRGR